MGGIGRGARSAVRAPARAATASVRRLGASCVIAMGLAACGLTPLFAAEADSAPRAAGIPQYGPWGYDLAAIDASVRPGNGFYDYANGRWIAQAAIPADKARVGTFQSLIDKTSDNLFAIVEEAARSGTATDTTAGKIGALYRAYMDETRLEELDATPIARDLDGARAAASPAEIATLMGRGLVTFGPSLFNVSVSADERDPGRYVVYVSQSGLGLPDRDYYLADTYKEQLAAYREYAAHLLEMIGWPEARQRADEIVAFEKRIAEASWTRSESRDRSKTYNIMTPAELGAAAPQFSWAAWLAGAKLDHVDRFIVRQATAIPKFAAAFADTRLATLKAWEAFHLTDETAPYLSRRFADAHFAFHDTVLSGQTEQQPRAKRGVDLVDEALGEALGREYVARYFPPKSRALMEELVGRLMAAMKERIERLSWMSAATKAKALEKLALIRAKIGYPAVLRDY
jgi:putative endopeptidase